MKKTIIALVILVLAVFLGLALFLSQKSVTRDQFSPDSKPKSTTGCNIENPDPKGYLLKICQYLREHNETVYPNREPDDYRIKEIEEGMSPGELGERFEDKKVFKVYLDCCYGAGDIAYFDKETEEVIYFSPGDR